MLHIPPDSQNEFFGMTLVFIRMSNGESLQFVSDGRVLEHVKEERANLLMCDEHAQIFKTKVGRKLLAFHASYCEADLPHRVPGLEVGMPSENDGLQFQCFDVGNVPQELDQAAFGGCDDVVEPKALCVLHIQLQLDAVHGDGFELLGERETAGAGCSV